MVDEEEVAATSKEITVGSESDGNTAPVLLFLIVVPTLLVSCTFLYFYASYQTQPDNNIIILPVENTTPSVEVVASPRQLPKVHVELQPNCTIKEHFHQLIEVITMELYINNQLCTPEDFHNSEKHNIPKGLSNNNKVAEAKGPFVIYIAVGLLMASLLAALVDVYKVTGKPSKTKPQLTKRCSLADLTVLRHSRRESMRKDSMVDEQRAPIKLLGARPPPEFRRSSFPVSYAGEASYGYLSPRQGSRKTSLDYYDDVYSYDFHHNRVVRIIRR